MDDNRDSARTMAKILELDGHDVSCVYDGLAVSERAASFQPDVLLVDIGLPGLDGYQVAQQIRQEFTKEKLMLIAVTGYGGARKPRLREARGIRPLSRQTGKPQNAARIAC